MKELKAGSYLAIMKDPELDLMDIVNETPPSLIVKDRYSRFDSECTLARWPYGKPQDAEERFYSFRTYEDYSKIAYENTHGLRFGNCTQHTEHFQLEPAQTPWPVPIQVLAHNHSPVLEDGVWHAELDNHLVNWITGDRSDTGVSVFGLACWDAGVTNELYPGYPGQPRHLVSQDDDLDIEAELVRAFDTIRPAISSDMSLLVTLAELKDVKSLFSEPISFANKVIRLFGRKHSQRLGLSEILLDPDIVPFIAKSLAKGHLYTEFGLKQTQRDICSLYSTFFSLDRTVREILSSTGSNTRHYSIPLLTRNYEEGMNWYFQDDNWICAENWNSVFNRKFVVTVKYTTELVDANGQPIDPRDTNLVKIGAAMDKLGLNMNPAILWDLVPFSFVVDYFVRIGDWLERFKRSNLNLTFGVEDSCYSVRRECRTWGSTLRFKSSWDGAETHTDHPRLAAEEYVGGVQFDYKTVDYERKRFVPSYRMLSGVGVPEIVTPNDGALKIMASLLTTNLPIFGKR